MKLPLNFLLHVTSAGLLGFAGWTFYRTYPETRREAMEEWQNKGAKEASRLIDSGRNKAPQRSGNWVYGTNADPALDKRLRDWWALLRTANFTGKLPPKPVEQVEQEGPKGPTAADLKPLEEILELVVLFHDGKAKGKGGESHIVVRYKNEANVQPPEWYLRETAGSAGVGSGLSSPQPARGAGGPGDVAPAPGSKPAAKPAGAKSGPSSPLPAATAFNRDKIQKVWVSAESDSKRETKLWPPYENIRLVQVAQDAQSAYFVRDLPPKAVDPAAAPGEAPKPPEPERLIKTNFNLSQDLLRQIEMLTGKSAETAAKPEVAAQPTGNWLETDETRRDPQNQNLFHIGRNDEKAFGDNEQQLLERVSADTYVSKFESCGRRTRGVRLTHVAPELGSRYGIAPGDVIVSINSESVSTKAEAVSAVKKQYRGGTRTFVVKFLSNGQYIERTYQAPNR